MWGRVPGMPAYNLIIIQVPKRQQISDFLTIRNMMYGRATDIDVHVLSVAEPPPSGFWQKMAERPSLIFSPIPVPLDPRLRGARLMAANIPKSEELRRLRIAGLPVPETLPITPDLRLDAGKWGPFTVIKPDVGYRGRGVALRRTRFVRWTDTSRLPEDDPRRGRLMLVALLVRSAGDNSGRQSGAPHRGVHDGNNSGRQPGAPRRGVHDALKIRWTVRVPRHCVHSEPLCRCCCWVFCSCAGTLRQLLRHAPDAS